MRTRRQALGQHFLKDQGVVDRILKMAESRFDAKRAGSIVEVGPGRMAITYGLANWLQQGVPLYLVGGTRWAILREGLAGPGGSAFLMRPRDHEGATSWNCHLRQGPVLFVSNLLLHHPDSRPPL